MEQNYSLKVVPTGFKSTNRMDMANGIREGKQSIKPITYDVLNLLEKVT